MTTAFHVEAKTAHRAGQNPIPVKAPPLGAEARARVGSLLDSLDTDVDNDSEAAWATAINRRVAELEAGTVRAIPWSEVRRRLFVRARHRALKRLREGLDFQWVRRAGSRSLRTGRPD